MKIAAIDPGLTGAAVVLEQIGGVVMLISAIDLPIMGDGAKRRLDAFTFAHWLNDHAPTHVYIEAGRAMPKQGVTSMFRYGRAWGAIEGVVAARGVPMTLVEPATWKRYLHLNSSKEDCRARALQLLPSAAPELQRVKDHHRAEAILLGFLWTGKRYLRVGETPMILRDYQQRDIAAIRTLFTQGKRRICYAAPTGSGKTVLFVHAARKAVQQGLSVAILVHRQELVDQTCEALAAEGIAYGIVAAGYPENADALVQVCMVQTLVRRSERLQDVKFLIVDEAHHILAATWSALAAAVPKARLLGVTATPERLDGKGLSTAFDTLVVGPTVKELIAEGWLSPFVVFAPEHQVDLKRLRTVAGDYALGELANRMNTDIVLADAIAEYRKHLDGQSALAFCVTIEHSRATARAFRAAGINAVHLDGDTPTGERRDIIAHLGGAEPLVVCNCGIIAEGLNVPVVAGVILLRPTRSLALYLQQIGRALRPAPGKQRAVILDHAGNVYRHGFPDLEHTWSLAGRPKKRGKALVKRCSSCSALIPAAARECPECAAAQPLPAAPPGRPVSRPLLKLDAMTAHERWLATGSFKSVMNWAGLNEARLHEVARARGYKSGWVYYRLKTAREASEDELVRAVWK